MQHHKFEKLEFQEIPSHQIMIIHLLLRLLLRPKLERLEVLEIFSVLFLSVRGLHIQASTRIPTITPITMPAMDPLSRLVFPVIVDDELLVTVILLDQTYINDSLYQEGKPYLLQ
jgi:hypothetical protein